MVHSSNTPLACATVLRAGRGRCRRRGILLAARPRLISNLLALVALISIGLV